MFGWQSQRESILRGAKISLKNKLEGARLMNELADRILARHQKILRRKLREGSN